MKRLLSGSIFFLLFTSCAATSGVEVGMNAQLSPNESSLREEFLVIGNRELGTSLSILKVDKALVGDLMRTSVTVRSLLQKTLPLQYRWVWYDANGFEVNTASQPWQPLLIYGGQTASIPGLAPNPSIKGFKIHLRYQD